MQNTHFFTNREENTLFKKFEGILTNVHNLHYFDALVGYFRASGYFKLRPFLENIPKIRILVGINVDRITQKYHQKGQLYLEDANSTKEEFLSEMVENIQNAHYDQKTEEGILQFLEDLLSEKLEVKAHPTQNIHAKIYIFRPNPFNEHTTSCEVITGSSNLTDSGMGTYKGANYEFNVSLRNYADVKFATDEFERLWSESVPILKAEAQAIKQKTYLRDDFTPYEIYLKMLIEYFGKRVEYDPYNIELLLPDKYIRLKYQADAANQGYAIMMKHNGFLLADVVGLGKTIVATMVAKKFIYENGTQTKVLVVVPPALQDAWERTVKDFQLDNHFRYITIGSLQKIIDKENHSYPNSEDIDMVIIDESHKFRNDYTIKYEQLQEICKIPRIRPAENGDATKKVILISATPMNNRPKDIENQLYFFQDKRNSTLDGIRNIQEYFKPLHKKYDEISQELKKEDLSPKERQKLLEHLKRIFKSIRNDIVEPLAIRRTRSDILNNKEYLEDLKKQGIAFPKVEDPTEVYYQLDAPLSVLFNDTVSIITGLDEDGKETQKGLGYYRYRAIEFLVKEEDKEVYGNVKSISDRLAVIMRTLLVKRLESSFFAFKTSLKRLQKALENMLEMFANDKVFVAPDLDINKLLEEGYTEEDIEAKITEKGGNNQIFTADAFEDKFIKLLEQDKRKIDTLVKDWEKVSHDPKLEKFMQEVQKTFFQKKKNLEQKLVIFTESKDTAFELKEALEKHTNYKVLAVSGDNRKNLEHKINQNFDANLEEEKQANDFNIIITTEVLAEGVNLHRSNVIINYDVPWNATRLMQRIGRVNRIGTKATQVYVYNFYPSAQGDAQIKLVNNALRKLQAFHTAFGEDSKVFSQLEEVGEGALYGNKIKQEESEILKYLNELREFKKQHPRKFKEIAQLPNKARCGRTAREKSITIYENPEDPNTIDYPLTQSSLAYLKSDTHPGIFCWVSPTMRSMEIGFLEAVKHFKAEEKEKAIKLHQLHYEQALESLEFFKSEKTQSDLQKTTARNLNPTEKKAVKNLSYILKFAKNEQEKNKIGNARKAVKNGTFKSLPKDINKVFEQHKKLLKLPAELIHKLFTEVLDRYNFTQTDNINQQENKGRGIINPQIVLTQSFK